MSNNIPKMTFEIDSSEDRFSIKKTPPKSSNAAWCKSPKVIIDLINEGKIEEAYNVYNTWHINPYDVEGNECFTNMIDRNQLLYDFDPIRLPECHNVLLYNGYITCEDKYIFFRNMWAEKEPHYFVKNILLAYNEDKNVVDKMFLFFATVNNEIKPYCLAKFDVAQSIINKKMVFSIVDTIKGCK